MPVTLRDIAKHLNLSHATVSFVLNERHDVSIPDSTRQRVMVAARELGYRPNRAARALVMGRTQMLAIWLPSLTEGYYARVFKALYTPSRAAGYDTIYCEASTTDRTSQPFDWPVDGVIAVDVENLLQESPPPSHMPVVVVGTNVAPTGDRVSISLESGAVEAVMHLVESGARRVAHLTIDHQLDDPHGRNSAYQRVVRTAGLHSELILAPDPDPSAVRATLTSYVAQHGLPEGLFCYNDDLALVALRVLSDLGKSAPTDCRVVGFDGLARDPFLTPSLSSVDQPVEEMASLALEFLMKRLKEPNSPDLFAELPTKLVVRESSQS